MIKQISSVALLALLAACGNGDKQKEPTMDTSANTTVTQTPPDTMSAVSGSKTWTGVKKMNEAEFAANIPTSEGVTVVDFSAEWCGPCKKLEPVLHALSEQLKGKVNFANVDVDESGNLAQQMQISNIPLIVFYKNGKEVDKLVGLQSEEDLRKKIQSYL